MSDNPARDLAATGTPGRWHLDGPWWWDTKTAVMVTAGDARQAVFVCPPPSESDGRDYGNGLKAIHAVNALSPLADLFDALDEAEHRESWTVDARYCIACARPWPCPTYATAERVKAALRGETDGE